jgi:3-deoxy-7-phosphoheptulonate synthase
MQLLDILNPDNTPGRITLIVRVGAGKVAQFLPPMIDAVRAAGRNVIWQCDPCHGNTESSPSGYKTRNFDNIESEIKEFFAVHESCGSTPGGIHLEMTGQNVTECVGGGISQVTDDDLQKRYESECDPRLNATQALELAFLVSEILQNRCLL